jgi:hypothetical protein
MSKEEVKEIVKRANEISSGRIRIKGFFDRSIFIGRHMDTGEYNKYCEPMRIMVNSLFERDVLTDLEQLLMRYHEKEGEGFSWLNKFFKNFSRHWNGLIGYTHESLSENNKNKELEPRSKYEDKIREIIDNKAWVENSNPRTNIIEPQLGYLLRNMEMDLQEGIGASHGLIAILSVD